MLVHIKGIKGARNERKIKGMGDVKTHVTLAREGKLVSVARDWHKRGEGGSESSDGWNVKQHVFKKDEPTNVSRPKKSSHSGLSDLYMDEKVKKQQIEAAKDQLQELKQAAAEGISVTPGEIERLEAKLSELGAG